MLKTVDSRCKDDIGHILLLEVYHESTVPNIKHNIHVTVVGETGVGWDKFWLGQCTSVQNESPDCDTNYVFGQHVPTAFTGATRIIE